MGHKKHKERKKRGGEGLAALAPPDERGACAVRSTFRRAELRDAGPLNPLPLL